MSSTSSARSGTSLALFLAALMFLSAVAHVVAPEAYAPLIPPFLPVLPANYLASFLEALVGVALLKKQWRAWGGLGFGLLMVGFLPLHIWDLTRDEPFVGSTWAAAARLFAQFFLIFLGWRLWKKG
ncbi:MAG: hypothetical protein MK135_17645 [Polyangiaceae bacterium]|nr:hypothetical protein [Polyangiaceae bacterium]